ncbi:MAG: hypothetical protein WBP61_09310 [Nocardioides sp.]
MRPLGAAGALLVGAVTGVATVALHELWWGLALALGALTTTMVALPPGWWSRLSFVVGFDAVVGWLTLPKPEGDYLISQDVQGYALLATGLVLLVVAIATLPRPVPRMAS